MRTGRLVVYSIGCTSGRVRPGTSMRRGTRSGNGARRRRATSSPPNRPRRRSTTGRASPSCAASTRVGSGGTASPAPIDRRARRPRSRRPRASPLRRPTGRGRRTEIGQKGPHGAAGGLEHGCRAAERERLLGYWLVRSGQLCQGLGGGATGVCEIAKHVRMVGRCGADGPTPSGVARSPGNPCTRTAAAQCRLDRRAVHAYRHHGCAPMHQDALPCPPRHAEGPSPTSGHPHPGVAHDHRQEPTDHTHRPAGMISPPWRGRPQPVWRSTAATA